MAGRAAAVLLVTLVLLGSSSAAFFAPRAQRLMLDAVLRRCEQYVLDYEPQVSRVVAREEYMQRLYVRNREDEPQSRRLVSDFLFLRLPGRRGSWLGIREVLEIDGLPANGRRRLDEAAAGATHAEIEALARKYALENARYNLGGFVRTVNVPFVVLSWMHPGFRERFDFDHEGVERIDGIDTWRIEFEEDERPTIIQTPEGDDVVSRGTIWIDPVTGRILQTELRNRPNRWPRPSACDLHGTVPSASWCPSRCTSGTRRSAALWRAKRRTAISAGSTSLRRSSEPAAFSRVLGVSAVHSRSWAFSCVASR